MKAITAFGLFASSAAFTFSLAWFEEYSYEVYYKNYIESQWRRRRAEIDIGLD